MIFAALADFLIVSVLQTLAPRNGVCVDGWDGSVRR